jgi:type VI protein secretion system component Hcp
MLDGFLELLSGGKPAIDGENLDGTFQPKHAIAIQSFSLTSESRSSRRAAERMAEGLQEGDGVPTMSEMKPGKKPSSNGKERRFSLNFQVTKPVDAASPPLFRAYCKHACLSPDDDDNKPIDVAKVTLRKAGGAHPLEYLVMQFTKVYVASYEVDGGGSTDKPPTETVSFTFKTISILYRPQKHKGQAAARQTAWNFDTPAT